MDRDAIGRVLSQLHQTTGRPRLEIEGAGELSIEAQYLTWIRHAADGKGAQAVYVLEDWYEDTSYVTEYRTECVLLPKAGLESLVEYALSAHGKAEVHAVGSRRAHYERWDDYSGDHSGSAEEVCDVLVKLSVDLQGGRPKVAVELLPFVPYPADLPPIAVANREPLCVNCAYVWLEPFGGRDPDSNHCSQMDATLSAFKSLTAEQNAQLEALVKKGALCPVFAQTDRYSPKEGR